MAQQGMSALNPRDQGAGIGDVMCGLPDRCFKTDKWSMKKRPLTDQMVGVFRLWERAAFLSGLLTRFKGNSIQPCTLLMMTPEEWGPWEADLSLRSPFTKTKPDPALGAKWDGQTRRCACKRVFSSSICSAHLNFNNSLLKQLLSLNVWMSLTRAQWSCW